MASICRGMFGENSKKETRGKVQNPSHDPRRTLVHDSTGVTPQASHGANVPSICEEGLRDGWSSLFSSAVMSAMKSLELVFLVLALWCSVLVASAGHLKPTRKQADEQFLTRQKDILGLLFGVGHKETFKSEHEDFDIAANAEHYSNVAAVAEFLSEFERGFLPDDEEFLLTNRKTLRQTIMLFDLFYYAKDFDTFYKTACWARKHVKDVQFAYVLYVAVYHRQDCRGMLLPAWYDVFPSSFISQEVMHKIYAAKMEGMIVFIRDN
ncbi:hypothetical protein AAG570_002556 [Ranatra chinensis]|uniref:Hemocyanin N-terminal domain-containing protein n=1 Tax=Ranatra chinensis TaxID=642074 RepID=A0ABD0Y7X6_9HEMI